MTGLSPSSAISPAPSLTAESAETAEIGIAALSMLRLPISLIADPMCKFYLQAWVYSYPDIKSLKQNRPDCIGVILILPSFS